MDYSLCPNWSHISTFPLEGKLTQIQLYTRAPILALSVTLWILPIYMSILLNSAMTQFNCNENQTRTFLKKVWLRLEWPPLLIHHTLIYTHTHSLPFLLRKKIASFPMSLSQKSKCDLSAYKYTILHFIQHTTSCSFISIYVCVCVHLFLKLYLYKYHLSVHVYIYLTNSIYLQISGVQYFLLINRTCRFTYCFFVQILTLSCSFNEIVLNHHSSRLNKTYTYEVLIMTSWRILLEWIRPYYVYLCNYLK